MRKFVFSFLLLVTIVNSVKSQVADQAIKVKSFSVDIKTGLFTATTTINIEFFNPNNKILDGEYTFSLNAGQVITGFALDINGTMREGVIVDKQQGRVAYENTIRRRIDPGLLEMTTGDNYRIRVYPMPANGSRKVKIIITEELSIKNDALVYSLPLDVKEAVLNFDLSILTDQGQEEPFTNEGMIKQFQFVEQNHGYTLQYDDRNIALKQAISFSIPIKKNSICFFNVDADKYFAAHIKPGIIQAKIPSYSSATVFWDVSGSAAKRNIPKEILFLEGFCREKKVSQLTIVTFSNQIHEVRRFNVTKDLGDGCKNFLKRAIFDGGTQLGILDCNRYPSDVYLLFSDGVSNYGNAVIKINSNPFYCISSSPSANQGFLKKVSDRTNGRFISLNSDNVGDVMNGLQLANNKLLSLHSNKTKIDATTGFPSTFSEWITISGKTRSETESFTLEFGDMGTVSGSETVLFNTAIQCDSADIFRLILLQQYATLQKDERFQHARTVFASTNKFVSNTTSFIVLDNLEDYIQFGIEPPADLRDEYSRRLSEITQRRQQQAREMENAMINNLRTSVTQYNERISWWDKNEPLIVFENVIKKNNEINTMMARRTEETLTSNTNNSADNNFDGAFDDMKVFGSTMSEVIVTTAFGIKRQQRVLGYSMTTIHSSELALSGNVAQALAGRVPGVQVIGQGSSGASQQIFIRGAKTLPNGGQPLYIVDGIAMDAEFAQNIMVNEIESITVLKGVQATILYGSRASNGAIIMVRKRARENSSPKITIVKYKNLEDVDYVTDLKDADKEEMYQRYLEMKDTLGEEPSFYFDAAEIMFESGDKETAMRILTNLLEIDNENHQLLRAVGYVFEKWGMYDEAVMIYEKVLTIKKEEPQSYRDLALAYEKSGKAQAAIEILYTCLIKNWNQYEGRYRGLRSILLTEMNTIIEKYKKEVDLSLINTSIIRPLPVDLRIVVDWNKDETDIDLHIVEPNGEECFYSHRQTKAGGRMAEDFTQGYGPEEYQIKNALKGKYSIQVNYYGDRYQKKQVPSFIKVTIYKNFGKPDQTVTTETFIMDNQNGKVEIAEVKW